MSRPCFLVIDREYAGSISTRKLVIETAKLNVITAYSGQEALETLQRFPSIDGVVMDSGMEDIHAAELAAGLKQMQPDVPVIVICAAGSVPCPDGDYQMINYDPAKLLELLKDIVGRRMDPIHQREHMLRKLQQENSK